MPRLVVITYLVAATLAGPSLCCCSLASLTVWPAPEVVQAPSPASIPRRCCCCWEQTEREPTASPRVQPLQAPRQPRDCPCRKQHRVSPAWCDAEAADLRLAQVLAPLDAAAPTPVLLRPVSLLISAPSAAPTAFVTSGDILRAPGVQRC